MVGTDDARRRYSAGKTDRWFGKLGSELGSGADGTVDPPVGDAIEVVICNNDEMALGAARRLNALVTQEV